jgi:hypothetical protein
MKTFIINGSGGSGKDTFVNAMREYASTGIISISSVGEVKEIAKNHFGWNGEKTPKWRKILSDLKDLQTSTNDGPLKYMLARSDDAFKFGMDAVFFHIREPAEIQKMLQILPAAKTILITREWSNLGNHADNNVNNFEYDYVIDNKGTLEEFEIDAGLFYGSFIQK